MQVKKAGLILCFLVVSMIVSGNNDINIDAAESNIECVYSKKGVLTIKGRGIVKFSDIKKSTEDELGYGVKKIIVEEGITGIEEECFYSVFEEVVSVKLPNTLTYLGKGVFEGCESLKDIQLSSKVTEIPERCFANCYNLSVIKIPDGVQAIRKNAFLKCERLEKIVLPKKLSVWEMPIKGCAMLKKVENVSTIDCELDDCKGKKAWRVKRQKVAEVPAGATATAKGKNYKIRYNLLGGNATKKLPVMYEYGSNMKLPDSVSKSGYSFLGWFNWKEKQPYYRTDISPSLAKSITLEPFWVKYKVKNIGNGKIQVTLDDRNTVVRFEGFYVRYSIKKNMSKAKTIKFQKSIKNTKTIKGLKENRYYYVQVACTEADDDFDNENIWVGKRKVYLKK